MSRISPYKTGTCYKCRETGNRENKPLIGNLCYTSEPFHYQKHQEEKKAGYAKKTLERQKEKEVKPIAVRSKKRAKEEREYSVKAKAFKLANPDCAARLKGCTGGTTDIHHQGGRSGEMLLDEFYWLPVCRSCHSWIELNPKAAKGLGLSVSRLETNAA